MKYILLFFTLIPCLIKGFFLNFKFGKPFKIIDKHIDVPIDTMKKEKLKNVSGFYGLIGPDVDMYNVSSLFQLFMGDGMIQGMFFDKGNVTFIKHYVKTEKLLYESKNGRIPKEPFTFMMFMLLNKMNLLPNHLGLANTALLKTSNDLYALYERDLPYSLDIDKEKHDIITNKRKYIRGMNSFSGHSKFVNENVETIDYNVVKQTINFHIFNDKLKSIKKHTIKTKYAPIIHDFISTNDHFLIADVPMVMDITQVIKTSLPVRFDKTKPSYFHFINKENGYLNTFKYNKGIYIFHHAYMSEDETNFYLYSCVYDEFNYLSLDVKGGYRCIQLNKQTKEVSILKNEKTEEHNLDFPFIYDNYVILRNLCKDDKGIRINGFVICDKLDIKHSYFDNDKCFCADPNIIHIDKEPYIGSFAYSLHSNDNFFCLIPLFGGEPIEIKIPEDVKVGFHSLYLPFEDTIVGS
jgi:hypothetical protein